MADSGARRAAFTGQGKYQGKKFPIVHVAVGVRGEVTVMQNGHHDLHPNA